jgi:hypothetical protein
VRRARSESDVRPARRSPAHAPRRRSQRADDVRAVRHRHRALGHRGQGGGAPALSLAGRPRARIFPPMRACFATARPTPSRTTPSRRSGAATATSSSTRSPCPR